MSALICAGFCVSEEERDRSERCDDNADDSDDTCVAEVAHGASGHAHLITHDAERMIGQRADPVL